MGAWLAGDAAYDGEISECMELARLGEHDIDQAAFVRCWCPTFYSFLDGSGGNEHERETEPPCQHGLMTHAGFSC